MTKKYEVAEKARDQLSTDYAKAVLSKGQLESLCRELQKQNKITKVCISPIISPMNFRRKFSQKIRYQSNFNTFAHIKFFESYTISLNVATFYWSII